LIQASINPEVASLIRQLAEYDFSLLTEDVDLRTATAKFYHYPSRDTSIVIIKVFYGTNAETLYTQEINALYALRATGRVSEVVCDSNRGQERFWDSDFSGPYFIAKPNYRTSLESVVALATEFEKLDLAAQEVVVASELLGAGWRDWDWSVRNDVVENGKVIRVDLDSATSLNTLLKDKGNVNNSRYFSTEEKETIKEFLLSRERITQNAESNEVRNMAIRLSYLLLPPNDHSELADQISEIQGADQQKNQQQSSSDNLSSSQAQPALRKSYPHRIITTIQALPKKLFTGLLGAGESQQASSNMGSGVGTPTVTNQDGNGCVLPSDLDAQSLKKWLNLWCGRCAGVTSQQPARLTGTEWQTISLTLYHLITHSEHGFSLQDLYNILVSTNASCLRDRISRQGGLDDACRTIDALSPSLKFFELRRYMRAHAKVAPQPLETEKVSQGDQESKDMQLPLQIKYSLGGEAWKATTKPLARECEDRVVYLEDDDLIVVALTDGVSDAEGFRSSDIVVQEVRSLPGVLKSDFSKDVTTDLRELLSKINLRLTQALKETKKPHQATLVLAVVASDKYSCRVSVAQAGNSDCVIFRRDDSIRAGASTINWQTQPLGRKQLIEATDVRIESFNLDAANGEEYRIRLFSDGVGDAAFERVKQTNTIEALVADAASWDKSLGIGTDDWSVAGVDLILERIPRITRQREGSSNEPKRITDEQAELLSLVNEPVFVSLSEPAEEFWREISDWTDESKPNSPEVVTEKAEPALETKRVGEQSNRPGEVQWKHLGLVVLALVVLGVVGYGSIAFFQRYYSEPTSDVDKKGGRNDQPGQDTPPQPTFATDQQRRIFSELINKHSFVRFGLTGGEALSGDVKTFVDDLAEVVKRGNLRTTFEIYSTASGRPADNLSTTNRRGDRIREYLRNAYGIEDQIRVLGKGSWTLAADNEVLPPPSERDKALMRILPR